MCCTPFIIHDTVLCCASAISQRNNDENRDIGDRSLSLNRLPQTALYLLDGSELLLVIHGPGIIAGLFLPILGAVLDAMLILVKGSKITLTPVFDLQCDFLVLLKQRDGFKIRVLVEFDEGGRKEPSMFAVDGQVTTKVVIVRYPDAKDGDSTGAIVANTEAAAKGRG
ncbi:TPA_asm: hypothetical protein HUJ06_032008 [Nelumbo nucifera]|uniref:Uncharacterized protein n=1 Tax=Nelumbo nucifera TaxID=4432 RepID=A0A822ZW11_NELNU|nr:TPA_asm: hypothetical protein HUJ06_023313 [Nelumbo nucifera]DAD49442.1 TPA_asm: hypothetical protein HUJ06_032008 [Nelumbo nucifera]